MFSKCSFQKFLKTFIVLVRCLSGPRFILYNLASIMFFLHTSHSGMYSQISYNQHTRYTQKPEPPFKSSPGFCRNTNQGSFEKSVIIVLFRRVKISRYVVHFIELIDIYPHQSFLMWKCKSYSESGFIVGKSKTSRMDALSVSSITSRSSPKPRPPVGGIPYSSAVTKSSST